MVKVPFPCCCGPGVDPCWSCIDSYPRQITITELSANRDLCYGTAAGTYDIPSYGTSNPSNDDVGFGVGTGGLTICQAYLAGFPKSEGATLNPAPFGAQYLGFTLDDIDYWIDYDPACPPTLFGNPNPYFGTVWSVHGSRKVIIVTVSSPRKVRVDIVTSETNVTRPEQTDCFGQFPDIFWQANRTDSYEIDLESCPDEGFAVPHLASSHSITGTITAGVVGTPAPGWSDPDPHYEVSISVLPPTP